MATTVHDAALLDDTLKSAIGDFGRWQFRTSLLMAMLKLPIAWFQLGIVFLAPPVEFRCKPFGNTIESNFSSARCSINPEDNSSLVPCRNFAYDPTFSTIVTEWDLVCERERLVDLAQIILMFGVLLGNVFFGALADKYGRKRILILTICFQSTFGILSSLSPWFSSFLFLRFLLGLGNGGTMIISFVMCMEVVTGKWRIIIPILYQIPFGLGSSSMAGLAYILKDWRQLQLALSMISALYILYIFPLCESPRWLITTGRKEEAVAVLEKAAGVNGIPVYKVRSSIEKFFTSDRLQSTPSIKSLFRTGELRKRTLLLAVNWLSCGISFYAFSQYLGQLTRNIYLAVIVGGFVSVPGTLLCVLVVQTVGRRMSILWAHCGTALCFAGISLIPYGMFPHDWPRVCIAALGIISLSISMPALYLYTGELFPTVVRNAGVGVVVMCSKLGSMLAPLIIALRNIFPMLPLTVLTVLALFEALLILPLPETFGKVLPETIQDVENINRRNENYLPMLSKEVTCNES